jgi:hypothetical protein
MSIHTVIKNLFKTPTPLQMAANELAEAERELLKAETYAEYAGSIVAYNTNRTKRLRAYMAAQTLAERRKPKEDV